jgi:hypothetical protein
MRKPHMSGYATYQALRPNHDRFGAISLSNSFKMKTNQAKNFLVQQTAEQAARESVPLSETEKKMMYFTESDATSCDNPVELNEEFEAQYDTAEYETKISRLLHHAYDRLKLEDPEGKRTWDQAIRALRKGDHYLLVLWDVKPPSEHPIRDSLKLLGLGMFIAMGVSVAAFITAKYKINLDRFRQYLPAPSPRLEIALYVGLVLLGVGGFYLFNWVSVAWLERKARRDTDPR